MKGRQAGSKNNRFNACCVYFHVLTLAGHLEHVMGAPAEARAEGAGCAGSG